MSGSEDRPLVEVLVEALEDLLNLHDDLGGDPSQEAADESERRHTAAHAALARARTALAAAMAEGGAG